MIRIHRSVLVPAACALLATSAAFGPAASATKETAVRQIGYQQWNSAAEFALGTFAGSTVAGDALVIGSPTDTFDYTDPYGDGTSTSYDVATWTSPEITPGFDYTELVGSWNAHTPAGTWIQVSVSGVGDDGTRSKDYILGRWTEDTSAIHRTSVPAQGDDRAYVAIDTLVARTDRSFSTWQLTVSLFRRSGTPSTPSVSLVGAMASRLPAKPKKDDASPLGGAEGIDLDVPTYSQEIHVGEYPEFNGGGEAWCSPTSTSMVLGYWGRGPSKDDYSWVDPSYDDPWVDYAAANTYDWNYDGTGNWPFNAAYAGRYGLESFVTRLRSLTEAEQFIKAGIPLVVSVSFKKSELTGAGYGTDGHLMVIRGFTDAGDVIVNDPASHLRPSDDEVKVVYDRAEFEQAWVPHSGGIVYVVHPADVPLPEPPAQPNW